MFGNVGGQRERRHARCFVETRQRRARVAVDHLRARDAAIAIVDAHGDGAFAVANPARVQRTGVEDAGARALEDAPKLGTVVRGRRRVRVEREHAHEDELGGALVFLQQVCAREQAQREDARGDIEARVVGGCGAGRNGRVDVERVTLRAAVVERRHQRCDEKRSVQHQRASGP